VKLFDGSERAFVGHDGAVTAVALTDAVIVSGGRDRTVRIWDRASGHAQVIDIFAGPIEGVALAASRPGGPLDRPWSCWLRSRPCHSGR